MEKKQELEWLEAQKIVISEDLLAAAKQQLQFLATIDRKRSLYEGPVLIRAIHRYKTYWLPLLAKHAESRVSVGPLVVPLDCEWIWHCHRLNPVQYKADCVEFYGRILDKKNVVSTVQGTSTMETEEIWKRLYPQEPYELDLSSPSLDNIAEKVLETAENTKYDLVSAVKRQSPFFYQVCRPSMNDDMFLEGAVARYKGFLHLIKRNRERSIRRFCVPTYDIDLIWHSHQLHPASYCKDLVEILGKVLEHDDTDSDRTKGKKLDTGFSETTTQWEETFGSRYWKAGAMNRGNAPSPLIVTPFPSNILSKKVVPSNEYQNLIQLPKTKSVEILLEIVGVRNLPTGHKGSLSVLFSKKQPDIFFSVKRRLTILSESREKQVAAFQCEPTGELLFELMSHSPSNLPISRPPKTMGTTSISLQDLLDPVSKLSIEKWFNLVPSSGNGDSKPLSLRIAVSSTVPSLVPHMLHMAQLRPFSKNSCFFPLPGRVHHAKSWTCVLDESGNEIISVQMRDSKVADAENNRISKKEVIGVIGSSKERVLAELVGNGWSLMDSHYPFQLHNKSSDGGHIFELKGKRMVKLLMGRKLEYELMYHDKKINERDFITIVEFSAEDPYGKALALVNLKSGILKVKEEWFMLLAITLAFILLDVFRKEGYGSFIANDENLIEMTDVSEGYEVEGEKRSHTNALEKEVEVPENGNSMVFGCGNIVNSGGCGGCGSGGCGNMVNSGGCGGCGGCGGGARNVVNGSGGCGGCGSGGCGGCGAGARNAAKSGGGCGGCGGGGCGGCGGGCGNVVKSSGCGGCGGGGGCGNNLSSEAPVNANEVGA